MKIRNAFRFRLLHPNHHIHHDHHNTMSIFKCCLALLLAALVLLFAVTADAAVVGSQEPAVDADDKTVNVAADHVLQARNPNAWRQS